MSSSTTDDAAQASSSGSTSNGRIIALLASVVFVAVVNGTMINVALPHIGADFNATEGHYGWLVTGYSLAFGIFNAINGKLADLWGRRRLYMAGIAALGLCSLLVAVAPTLNIAIAIRILQGAGAAALPVLGTTILKTLVPPERRGRAIGVILSTVGVAASIGPFLGGLLVQLGSWRAVFVIPSLVLLALPLAWRLLPKSLDTRHGTSFDPIGATLLGAGIALVVYGMSTIRAGLDPLTLAWSVGGGVAALVAFGVWITRTSREPFVAPSLFKQPAYLLTSAIGFFTNATRFGSVVLAPIFLDRLNGMEPIWVGAVLFPGAVAIALLSPQAGKLADTRGPRVPVAIGQLALVLGSVISAVFAGGSPVGVAVGMTLFGVGFAMSQSPLVNTATQLVPEEQSGSGLGLFMMIFFVGGGFGVAVSVTATELQGPDAAGLFGLGANGGGPFANALLLLAGMGLLGLALVGALPKSLDVGDEGTPSDTPSDSST